MRFFNPATISRPASHYSQGVTVPANAERLIIAGQIGASPEMLFEVEGEAVAS